MANGDEKRHSWDRVNPATPGGPVTDLELCGCTPEPLMSYLKSLGILRLISEQKDGDARGWWKDDVFWLRSPGLFQKNTHSDREKREALASFFLEQYRPTPIVAPWAGGSGFFPKDNKKAVTALRDTEAPRLRPYSVVIRSVQSILHHVGIGSKPKDDEKASLLRRYRRDLPDLVLEWIDAVMVLQEDGQDFAPLLGTGGNDGRLDFTQNFMQRIVALGLHTTNRAEDSSRQWLEQSLFGVPGRLASASVGQFAPGRAGGPNATQGLEGDPMDNPWEFVLMLEGTLMLAGAAVRRLGLAEAARSAFPFTVRSIAAGFDTPALKDQSGSRGETWIPLWNRPAGHYELRRLFGEARADISGRAAQDGNEFARAAASLGVDRGITEFRRVAFLKRSGKAFLAASLGRFEVRERPGVDLLREADAWLGRLRDAARDRNAPPRLGRAVCRIDAAVFDFCRYGGASFFQRVLVALGRAERLVAALERFREKKRIRPLGGLSPAWIDAAHDGSPEFRVALALSSVHDPERKIGPLRANLEPVDWRKRCHAWAERNRSVVWNAADVATNLAGALERRQLDANRAGCELPPLASRSPAALTDVAWFLDGGGNDERLEDLLWSLTLVDCGPHRKGAPADASGEEDRQALGLSRDYAILKPLFLPRPLVAERSGETFHWRLARRLPGGGMESGLTVHPEPRLLPLLRTGRIGEACRIAAQRLRVSGLSPLPGPARGVTRDSTWEELNMESNTGRRGTRLAAALLIPISSSSAGRLVGLVCRDQPAAAERFAHSAEGEPE